MLLRRLSQGLIAATLLLVAWGGIVSSSGSGLACGNHWPDCLEVERAEAGESVQPTMTPRMEGGVAIEHGHRLFAWLVGCGAIALVVAAFRRRPIDRGLRRASVVSLSLVVVQGLLGGLTVRLGLPPAVSTLHLTFSMAFAASLLYVAFRSRPDAARLAPASEPRRLYAVAVVVVFAQLVLGALVRHTGSAPACAADFPLCNGSWLPRTVFQWVHVSHRIAALVVLVLVIVAAVRAGRRARALGRPGVRALAGAAHGLVTLQVALGILTVVTGIQPHWATLHQVIGALLFLDMLAVMLGLGPLGAPSSTAPTDTPLPASFAMGSR